MNSMRTQRVADELKRVLGDIFLKDFPVSHFGLLTVTRVICSSDLRQAKVYISVYNKNSDFRKKAIRHIRNKASRIRNILARKIVLKNTPKLIFFEDDSQEYAEKIERLIQSLHSERSESA